MRRFALVLTLALLTIPLFGALAPVAAHAQTVVTAQPTISVSKNPVQTGDTTTVMGTGFTLNYYAYVFYQRPDGTTNAVNVATDSSGRFSFTLGFLASHGTGTESVRSYDYGTRTYSNTVSITVTSGTPPATTLQLTSDRNPVTPGQVVTITGTGFTPWSTVYFSYQRPDGTRNAFYVRTDSTGRFDQQLGFLRSHGCGSERVQAYDFGTARYSSVYTLTVTGC